MDFDEVKRELLEAIKKNYQPFALLDDDPRLEDAFKHPICDEQECADKLPIISKHYTYGELPEGIKILSCKSAKISSCRYTRYIDEEALVWDSTQKELFLYIPNIEHPRVAFKGSCWIESWKLKEEYQHLNLHNIYMEVIASLR